LEAQKGSVPSIKKRAAAGVRFRFVRVAAVDARIDVLVDEALQRSAPGRSGVNVKVLAAVRIRAGWNKPVVFSRVEPTVDKSGGKTEFLGSDSQPFFRGKVGV
jgi:hypothetical protein